MAKTRFEKCEEEVAAKGGAYDPAAVCAAAGRKKYGKKKFQKMALAGRENPSRRKTKKKVKKMLARLKAAENPRGLVNVKLNPRTGKVYASESVAAKFRKRK